LFNGCGAESFIVTGAFTWGLARIDVMINNAGLMPQSPLERLKLDEWDWMIDLNIRGCGTGSPQCCRTWSSKKPGISSMVFSVAGHKAGLGFEVYAATKFAVRTLSEGLRQEVKPYNIRTTVISPGSVATELLNSITESDVAETVRKRVEDMALL
jgi:NADP-dependent 3-hydroxy acid dehydrogenase YdfG